MCNHHTPGPSINVPHTASSVTLPTACALGSGPATEPTWISLIEYSCVRSVDRCGDKVPNCVHITTIVPRTGAPLS